MNSLPPPDNLSMSSVVTGVTVSSSHLIHLSDVGECRTQPT